MVSGRNAQSGPSWGYVVIPVDELFQASQLTDSARHLIQASSHLARGRIGAPVEMLAVNAKARHLWQFSDGRPFPLSRFAVGGIHVLMNEGFLLSDTPPLEALIQQAQAQEVAWCGTLSTHDTHAFVFAGRWFMRRFTSRRLWQALTHLTACIDDTLEDIWRKVASSPVIAPSPFGTENSPAMRHVRDAQRRRWVDSPRFLNTALKEIISDPQSRIAVGNDPGRLADALAAQRDASRVPWVFNTLLNEIDYRLGSIQPRSFPPELHLSLTGRCNIECRFCGYTHAVGR